MRRRRAQAGWIMPMLLVLGVGVLGAIRGGRPGGDIVWESCFEAAQAEAQQAKMPMLLSFHTPGCGWCRKLDAETFTDPKVLELSRRFVGVHVESDDLFIRDGRIWTSTSITAGLDLMLAIVEEDHGHEAARTIAKSLVLYLRRADQQALFSDRSIVPEPELGDQLSDAAASTIKATPSAIHPTQCHAVRIPPRRSLSLHRAPRAWKGR